VSVNNTTSKNMFNEELNIFLDIVVLLTDTYTCCLHTQWGWLILEFVGIVLCVFYHRLPLSALVIIAFWLVIFCFIIFRIYDCVMCSVVVVGVVYLSQFFWLL